MFLKIFLAGAGGFIGCIIRYIIGLSVQGSPIGTVIVNLAGCFFIGLISTLLSMHNSYFDQFLKPFVITGFMGGLTTFSSYGLDSITLIRNNQTTHAIVYIFSQLIIGLLLVYIGEIIAKKMMM